MVVFGLFGKQNVCKKGDVLDELMGLNDRNKFKNDLNTSSFDIDDIMSKLSAEKSIDYKNALLNSLYSQVEFLKQEAIEINNISTRNLTCDMSNLDHDIMNSSRNDNSFHEHFSDCPSGTIKDSTVEMEIENPDDFIEQLEEIRRLKSYEFHNRATKKGENEFAAWEKYTSKFGSRMLEKMGYNGGGLGKSEDGIINPITITRKYGRGAIGSEVRDDNQIQFIDRGLEKLHAAPVYVRKTYKVFPWPSNTTLITGSSILYGVDETRLKKYKAKVRVFPGAVIDDMYHYLTPLLKKKPSNIILHIGSNDAPYKTVDEIENDLSKLTDYIQKILPSVKIFLSSPTVRTDNIQANMVLRQLYNKLKDLPNIILNENVDISCLGKKGLHLNPKGSGRLAINYISLMKRL